MRTPISLFETLPPWSGPTTINLDSFFNRPLGQMLPWALRVVTLPIAKAGSPIQMFVRLNGVVAGGHVHSITTILNNTDPALGTAIFNPVAARGPYSFLQLQLDVGATVGPLFQISFGVDAIDFT